MLNKPQLNSPTYGLAFFANQSQRLATDRRHPPTITTRTHKLVRLTSSTTCQRTPPKPEIS